MSTVVSVVDLTATAGGIAPGQFQQFPLSAGAFPDKGTFVFEVLQTYSDGTRAARIAPTVAGRPEHPAPVLQLTASSSGAGAASASPSDAAAQSSDPESSGVALFLAILALAVAVAAVVLAVLNRRRTVAS